MFHKLGTLGVGRAKYSLKIYLLGLGLRLHLSLFFKDFMLNILSFILLSFSASFGKNSTT